MTENEQLCERLYKGYLAYHREISKELHERLGEKAADTVKIEILSRIDDGCSVYSKDLALAMGYTPSAIAQQISNLEKEGLLTRKRSLHDKRVLRLQLTEPGKELLLESRKQLARSINKVTSRLDEKDLKVFCELFEKMAQ